MCSLSITPNSCCCSRRFGTSLLLPTHFLAHNTCSQFNSTQSNRIDCYVCVTFSGHFLFLLWLLKKEIFLTFETKYFLFFMNESDRFNRMMALTLMPPIFDEIVIEQNCNVIYYVVRVCACFFTLIRLFI